MPPPYLAALQCTFTHRGGEDRVGAGGGLGLTQPQLCLRQLPAHVGRAQLEEGAGPQPSLLLQRCQYLRGGANVAPPEATLVPHRHRLHAVEVQILHPLAEPVNEVRALRRARHAKHQPPLFLLFYDGDGLNLAAGSVCQLRQLRSNRAQLLQRLQVLLQILQVVAIDRDGKRLRRPGEHAGRHWC